MALPAVRRPSSGIKFRITSNSSLWGSGKSQRTQRYSDWSLLRGARGLPMTHLVYRVALHPPSGTCGAQVGGSFTQRGEQHVMKLLRYLLHGCCCCCCCCWWWWWWWAAAASAPLLWSEREHWKKMKIEIFSGCRASKSEVREVKKTVPSLSESQGRRLIFILSTFFSCSGWREAMREARRRYWHVGVEPPLTAIIY